MEQPIAPGAEGLIKHTSGHSDRTRYQAVKVTRVTKARVFVRAAYDGAPEREFRLDNLREYGEKSWRADKLVVDPGALERIARHQASEQARRSLEAAAMAALADVRKLFEGYTLQHRTEAEIAALVALRDSLCVSAAENAGPC